MIDHINCLNYNQDLQSSFTKSRFLTKKLYDALKKNINIINDCLGIYFEIDIPQNGININLSKKRNFFSVDSSSENDLTLVNFKNKKYFYISENKHNGFSNKLENYIFVLNQEEEIFNNYSKKEEFIGCQIFENGKLFAGKFNNAGKLNGEGIYINKKGNLIYGNFQNSDIKRGRVNTSDGIEYEGTLKNLKRQGKGQKEIKKGCYEFIGDFENDKRVKGKFIYDQTNPKFKYLRNANIDDFNKLKENDKRLSVSLRFKFKEREYFYNGILENSKLNDENASLLYTKKGYPKYEGCIQENCKVGKGKYWWSLEEFYSGSFVNNKFHSYTLNGGLKEFLNNPENKKKNENELNIIKIGQKTYSVIFDKGDLLGYVELKNF